MRIIRERIDNLGSRFRSHSHLCPGHEDRMKSHEMRIHTMMGPMKECICQICRNYRKTKTKGIKHGHA